MDMSVDVGQDKENGGHRTIFSPPLSTQRYCWVQQFLESEKDINTVTDVGCGNGRMLNWLKTVPHLEAINCVDSDNILLEDQMDYHFRPNLTEMLFGRKNSLKKLDINIFHGDIAVPDDRLQADCFTLVEVIEHMLPEQVERTTRTVFGFYQPKYVVITTPNSEFNHLLRKDSKDLNPNGFRHYDHKFEWTRSQFMQWTQQICSSYPYQVLFDGVGHLPGSDPYGPCTQIALFKRTTNTSMRTEGDLLCFDLFLNKLSMDDGRPECLGDWRLRKVCLLTSFQVPGAVPSDPDIDGRYSIPW